MGTPEQDLKAYESNQVESDLEYDDARERVMEYFYNMTPLALSMILGLGDISDQHTKEIKLCYRYWDECHMGHIVAYYLEEAHGGMIDDCCELGQSWLQELDDIIEKDVERELDVTASTISVFES